MLASSGYEMSHAERTLYFHEDGKEEKLISFIMTNRGEGLTWKKAGSPNRKHPS
jgi:hypothetical protein